MMQLPEKLKSYVEDYKIKVYDIAFLSDNVIEKFTSDFKFVARFFKDRRLKKNTLRKDEMAKIRHVEALKDAYSSFEKVYQAVISTEAYAHVTEDQVREYYDR